jgi:hypothetical protein
MPTPFGNEKTWIVQKDRRKEAFHPLGKLHPVDRGLIRSRACLSPCCRFAGIDGDYLYQAATAKHCFDGGLFFRMATETSTPVNARCANDGQVRSNAPGTDALFREAATNRTCVTADSASNEGNFATSWHLVDAS